MENQPPLHRVSVYVRQLLSEFLLAPNVEIVKPPLPEMPFLHLCFGKLQPELTFGEPFAFFPKTS